MYKACKNEGNLFSLLNQESFFELLTSQWYENREVGDEEIPQTKV